MGDVAYKYNYSLFYQIQITNIRVLDFMHLCACKLDAFQFMGDVVSSIATPFLFRFKYKLNGSTMTRIIMNNQAKTKITMKFQACRYRLFGRIRARLAKDNRKELSAP